MKLFNQIITVEVSVDAIANQLLESIVDSNPHREMIVETVIATALNNNSLSYLYNSLNGYTNDINFKIGDEVICNEKVYQYVDGVQEYVPIGNCIIKEINVYDNNKVVVEYTKYSKDGTTRKDTMRVSHINLSK